MAIVKDPAADTLNEEIQSQTIAPLNIIRNGSFEDWNGDTPLQWSKIGTPTVVRESGDRDNFGAYAVKITTSSADEGIEYTFSNLRASKTYSVYARAMRTTGTAKMWTYGAGTEMTPQTTTSTSWFTLVGYFTTDGAPTSVKLRIGSANSGDVIWFDSVPHITF